MHRGVSSRAHVKRTPKRASAVARAPRRHHTSVSTQRRQAAPAAPTQRRFIATSTAFRRSLSPFAAPMPSELMGKDTPIGDENITGKRSFVQSSDEEKFLSFRQKDLEDRLSNPLKPSYEDYAQAQATIDVLKTGRLDISRDEQFPWLDPLNPPNLTYQHVKLLKNIDYSPLIRRANQGGMFTVEDVITILQKDGVTDQFKSAMRREHLQDPFIFEQTYDVFNNGKKPCPLCLPDPTEDQINRIHYTNVNLLRKYVSTTGMIIPRRVSGVCQMHQKKLRYAIKNAKQLALLSYTTNWHVPLSYVYPEKYPAYEDQNAAADVERVRRQEIKELFDNLVSDKRSMLAGKSLEEVEAAREQLNAEQFAEKQAQMHALQEGAQIQEEHRRAQLQQQHEIDLAKVEGNSQLTPEQKAQQVKDLELALHNNIEEGDLVKQLKRSFTAGVEEEEQSEVASDDEAQDVTDNEGDEEAEAEKRRLSDLKSDFGDLVNLETFDPDMSFEEFLARYNDRAEEKMEQRRAQGHVFFNPEPSDVSDLEQPPAESTKH